MDYCDPKQVEEAMRRDAAEPEPFEVLISLAECIHKLVRGLDEEDPGVECPSPRDMMESIAHMWGLLPREVCHYLAVKEGTPYADDYE